MQTEEIEKILIKHLQCFYPEIKGIKEAANEIAAQFSASPTEGIEAMAEEYVNAGTWGNPTDKTGKFMFSQLKEAWIKGYKSGLSASPQEWISVEDRLPDYDEPVLWYLEDGLMHIEDLDKDGNPGLLENSQTEGFDFPKATHWTPLPAPPINTDKK